MQASHEELIAAAQSIPTGKNALKHLFEALRLHTAEQLHLQK